MSFNILQQEYTHTHHSQSFHQYTHTLLQREVNCIVSARQSPLQNKNKKKKKRKTITNRHRCCYCSQNLKPLDKGVERTLDKEGRQRKEERRGKEGEAREQKKRERGKGRQRGRGRRRGRGERREEEGKGGRQKRRTGKGERG